MLHGMFGLSCSSRRSACAYGVSAPKPTPIPNDRVGLNQSQYLCPHSEFSLRGHRFISGFSGWLGVGRGTTSFHSIEELIAHPAARSEE